MPKDVDFFFYLTDKPQKGVKKKQQRSILDLSTKCPHFPNWSTNKEGNCRKLLCDMFKKPGCPARENV